MVNGVLYLIDYFWGTIAAFEALLIIHWASLFTPLENVLIPGLLLSVLATFFWIAMFYAIRFVKRAFLFYLYLALGSMVFSFVVLTEIMLLGIARLGRSGWIAIALLTIWLLVGFYQGYTRALRKLSTGEESIINAGRLDKGQGIWDLTVPWVSEKRKDITGKAFWVEVLLWITGLGIFLLVGRALSNPLVMTLILIAIASFMLMEIGDCLAYTAQILGWEKDTGQKIYLHKRSLGEEDA